MQETVAKVKVEAAAQASANMFENATATENNKDTTAVNHLSAVSAENFADRNPEMVVDEAKDLELYASEFAEEVEEENFANTISEKAAANIHIAAEAAMPATPSVS